MKKQIKYIVIAAVLLAVLVGALIFLLTLPDKKDDNSGVSSDTATTLIAQTASNIEQITVKNSGGEYTLTVYNATVESLVESSGETSVETTTEAVYTMQGYENYFVDQDKVDSLAYDCSNLVSSKTINSKNNSDSDYGLDEPRAVVNIRFSDGSEKTVKVGSNAPGDESVYVRMGDAEKIYLVSADSVKSMLVEKLQMFDKTVLKELEDDETVSALSISGSGRKTPLLLEKNSFSSVSDYYMTSPQRAACDKTAFSELCEQSIFPITADSTVAVDVTDEQIKKYGLDNPYYILEASTDIASYKVLVSKPDKDKNCYIMKDGSKAVFKIASSEIEFMGSDGSDIMSKTVIYPNIIKLKNIEVLYDKTTDKYDITNKSSKNSDNAEYITSTVKLNEADIKSGIFSAFLRNLSVLERSSKIPEYDEKSSPILSVTVTYNNDTKDTVAIHKSEKKAVVVLNGKAVGTAELEIANELLSDAKLLAVNTEFDSLITEEEASESKEASV